MPNSKLIREVGLSDGIVIHAATTQKANPAYTPTSEAALQQQAASPITLLSQQVRLSTGLWLVHCLFCVIL